MAEWTEEVKLHDGQMATVERRARACAGGFPNANRGRDIDFELKYQPLNIDWQGPAGQVPIGFDIVDGTPYWCLTWEIGRRVEVDRLLIIWLTFSST